MPMRSNGSASIRLPSHWAKKIMIFPAMVISMIQFAAL